MLLECKLIDELVFFKKKLGAHYKQAGHRCYMSVLKKKIQPPFAPNVVLCKSYVPSIFFSNQNLYNTAGCAAQSHILSISLMVKRANGGALNGFKLRLSKPDFSRTPYSIL